MHGLYPLRARHLLNLTHFLSWTTKWTTHLIYLTFFFTLPGACKRVAWRALSKMSSNPVLSRMLNEGTAPSSRRERVMDIENFKQATDITVGRRWSEAIPE